MTKRNRPTPFRAEQEGPKRYPLSISVSAQVSQKHAAIEQARQSAKDFMEGIMATMGLDTTKNWTARQTSPTTWEILEAPDRPDIPMPPGGDQTPIGGTDPVLPPSEEAQGGDVGDSPLIEPSDPPQE